MWTVSFGLDRPYCRIRAKAMGTSAPWEPDAAVTPQIPCKHPSSKAGCIQVSVFQSPAAAGRLTRAATLPSWTSTVSRSEKPARIGCRPCRGMHRTSSHRTPWWAHSDCPGAFGTPTQSVHACALIRVWPHIAGAAAAEDLEGRTPIGLGLHPDLHGRIVGAKDEGRMNEDILELGDMPKHARRSLRRHG